MKTYKYIFYIIIAASMVSCDDYLDLEPISEETTGNAYNSASQIEAALVGVYESLQSSEYYVWDNIIFQDIRSDNCYAGGDNAEIFSADYLTITPTNSRLFKHWSNLYNAISKANIVLDKVDGINDASLTEERRNQIKGEALFMRSYFYFTLVKMWGGVPLVLSPVDPGNESTIYVSRSTEEEVYTQIIADLQTAAALLPDVYGNEDSVNKARATRGAANALLAKAYAQKPNADYSAVIEHVTALENSAAGYTLIDYAELFDGNHYNNQESILEIQYLGGTEGSYGPQLFLPPSISGDTWRKFATPSHNLIDAYDAEGDDIRKNASIIFENAPWVDEYWNNQINSSIPFAYKWKNASSWASADDVYVLRYGDLLLLKAEAYNETGQIPLAVEAVNTIRNRVNLPNLSASQYTDQATLHNVILNERRLELALEGHRWDDLARNNALVSTMNNLVEINLTTGNAVEYNMTQNKKLLPIPQQELDRNPNLTQNPL